MLSQTSNPFSTKWISIGLLIAAMAALSACNTVEGLGRDVESAGEAVSDTAEDAKN